MSSEETPPLHFRLKPNIPLKLRSFLLSPPDPLRWAPAGAPLFSVAPKRESPPEGLLAALRLTLAGRARFKREKALGQNFTARVKFAQGTGAGLNRCFRELPVFYPAASDPVPPRTAPPQSGLPSRVFCIFDARPPAPLPALRAWLVPFGMVSYSTGFLVGAGL